MVTEKVITSVIPDNGTHTATSDQTGYVTGRTLEGHGKIDKIEDEISKGGLVLTSLKERGTGAD